MSKFIRKVYILLSLLIIILTLFIYKNNITKEKIVYSYEEIIEKIPEINYEEELNELKQQYNNNDIVATLSIENTSFNEIIMQSTDNDYYLEHTVYHDYNWMGQSFLDYRLDVNNSKKLIIYGHNSAYYNLPFEIFENYYNKEYLNDHKYLYLQTDKNIKIYEIFSVYVEVKDWSYYSKMNFLNDEEYYNHILKLKNNSLYDTEIEINKDDEILIIQTCSTHKDYAKYENKYLLVIGKRIDEFDKK